MGKVETSKLNSVATTNLQEPAKAAKKKKSYAGSGMNGLTDTGFDLAKSQQAISTKPTGFGAVDGGPSALKLSSAAMTNVNAFAKDLSFSNPGATNERWQGLVAGMQSGGEPMDINALVQHVLREAYLETNKDLQFFADKVKYYNELKQNIRDELSAVRQRFAESMKANPNAGPNDIVDSAGIQQKDLPTFPDMQMKPAADGKQATTKKQVEAYIAGLEQKLSSVGDDAQLANIDLQNKLQQQQQTLQSMSNVSKMLHDTAMSVVRKIG